MKFRHLVLLTLLVGIAAALQQFNLYLGQWQRLDAQRREMTQLSGQIEELMYEEDSLRQRLAAAEQQHAKLRRLLPEALEVEELEKQVAALAAKHGIKILATKTAVSSLPDYREATTSITLEAGKLAARRFMRELKSIPRRIHIIPPEKRGEKSIHLTISIYAVDREVHEGFTAPPCSEMPKGLFLPPLLERLTPLYENYKKQCNFVTNYGELLNTQRQLQALQQENKQLQALEKRLRRRP
jgi:Tfp pilus assembly protein PilO